jgi:hypothetical protein
MPLNRRTNALNGHPFIIHDAEGLPSLPFECDDEMLSDKGPPSAASGHVSYMIGFNTIARIFQMIYQCIWRQRTYQATASSSPNPDKLELDDWAEAAKVKLQNLLASLPLQLRPDFSSNEQGGSVFGMQAANISITALCLELTLVSGIVCVSDRLA